MPTGRTGYTAPTNALPPEGPAQMTAIYEHFDALMGQSFTLIADLPSSGNWVGRSAYVTENDAIYKWDSGWTVVWQDWTSYTPTVTGITLGTGGSHTAEFRRDGHEISVSIRTVFGTGGAVTAQPTFTLPTPAADSNVEFLNGQGWLKDATGSEFPALIRRSTNNTIAPYSHQVVSSQVQFANVSATVPFTWAANDLMKQNFNYKAA